MASKKVKICVFDKHSTKNMVLFGNGDAILDNICIQCTTTERLDGTHELDAVFVTDEEGLYKYIDDEVILKVAMDYGNEIYRVAKVSKQERQVTVFARQITISETLDMWIEDVRPTAEDGLTALTMLKENSIGKKDIDVFSDIKTFNTAYFQSMCMYQAIQDSDQSFINRWGGEIQRRGYSLTINNRIGADRGVEIRSKKNLIGFEANTNIDNVVTRIRAVGFDGIYAGQYVDSPLINNYSAVKTKEIKYEDVKLKGTENNPDEGFDTLDKAQEELIRRAGLEFSENKVDELRADYRINFIYLEQTEEYKNFVQAERVYIGDTVSVFEEKHDLNIHVRVIGRKYDILNQKVLEIELSNSDISSQYITSSDILAELQGIISSSGSLNIKDMIQNMINSGSSDGHVLYRQNELLVLDNRDIGSAQNVIRVNKDGVAFSQNGYYGQYEYGITIDGAINASMITTGILSKILIKNSDGSLQIDLAGNRGIVTRKNGVDAVELSDSSVKFYDLNGRDVVGELRSSKIVGDERHPGVSLVNEKDSYLSLGYLNGGRHYNYIRFDKDNIDNKSSVPITFFEESDFGDHQTWYGYNVNSIGKSATGDLVVKNKNNFIIKDLDSDEDKLVLGKGELNLYNAETQGDKYFYCSRDGLGLYDVANQGNRYLYCSPDSFSLNDATNQGREYFSCSSNGFSFAKGNDDILYTTTSNKIQSEVGLHIDSDLTVNGSKACVQKTDNHGEVLFYSVSDCGEYLTDRTMDLLTVEDMQGTFEKLVLLDEVFKESIDMNSGYTVEIIKQGWGDYRIKEQTENYFIVESNTLDFTFKYIVTGKRKGYENKRNEQFQKGIKQIISKISKENE